MRDLRFPLLLSSFSAALIAGTVSSAQAQSSVEVPRVDLQRLGQTVPGYDPTAFKMQKTTWSAQDEAEFVAFVQSIGTAVENRKCNTVANCMKSAANPFRSSDPKNFRYYSDCADWPYFARGYFAWKKGLPFSFVSAVRPRNANDEKKDDLRYTRDGNKPTRRIDSVASWDAFPSATFIVGRSLSDAISTAMFRMPVIPQAGEALSDFHAVPVNRDAVRPGTALYSADGHVAMVYRITTDGIIKVIDAHPDNSLTLNEYGPRFIRSRSVQGAIFKNFRPLQLIDATPDAEGNLIGGSIRVLSDNEIPEVNYEQAKLSFPTPSDYFFWVRRRMAASDFKIDVLQDFKRSVENLCNVVGQRVHAVNTAIQAGMDDKPNPERMVKNIFGADGEWEEYSSPGRDISLRLNYKATLDSLKYNVESLRAGKEGFKYGGNNLAQDLFDMYRTIATSCPVSYTSRDGSVRKLDLEQVRVRLFQISFDPYHCIDLRWGDIEAGRRLCGEDMRWYAAEQYLRNLTERRTADSHDLSIEEMEAENLAKNQPFQWDTNIIDYINTLANSNGVSLR